MSTRRLLGLACLVAAVTVHYGIYWGLLLAAVFLLADRKSSVQHPTPGHVDRVRAAVVAAWRRLRGRRQAVAAIAMAGAVVALGVGVGLALGTGWGLVAAGLLVAGLSFYVELYAE